MDGFILVQFFSYLMHLVGQMASAANFGSQCPGFESRRRQNSSHDFMALHCAQTFITFIITLPLS